MAGDLRGAFQRLTGQLDRQRQLTGEAQDQLLKLRLVPFASLVPRLERAVRVTAESRGKQARLEVRGEEVEIDKQVLEELADSLLHLVRNAVDHGIEEPRQRQLAAKPEVGTVTIRAAHEGRLVVLRIEDDGAGLDAVGIGAAALRQGLLDEEELAGLGEEEVLRLALRPGLSTAREVSQVSGRGVGLDVVEQAVRRLKGSLVLGSRRGVGSSFTVRLPRTLAIDRVLLARAGDQTVAVPESSVERVVRLAPEEVVSSNGRRQIRLDGEEGCSLFALADLLRVSRPEEVAGDPFPALIVRAGERLVAVAVEQLLGAREVVVKDLGSHLKQVTGVRGATLMGDGQVVLILDPGELVRGTAGRVRQPPLRPSREPRPTEVLIVDDSLSVRRVLSNTVRRAGFHPLVARDGLEALELLQQAQTLPQVLLLDIEMPRMDGYELTSTLRALEEFRHLPIVMITSRAGEKHRRRAFELGVSEYLVKPYQEEELVATVRRLSARDE